MQLYLEYRGPGLQVEEGGAGGYFGRLEDVGWLFTKNIYANIV